MDYFLLLGDFNLPVFHWNSYFDYSSATGYHSSIDVRDGANYYSQFCKLYKLFQFNSIKNVKNNILDLLFSIIKNTFVDKAIDTLISNDIYHYALSISVPINFYTELKSNEFFFDFQMLITLILIKSFYQLIGKH